jgi:hypothetical protein
MQCGWEKFGFFGPVWPLARLLQALELGSSTGAPHCAWAGNFGVFGAVWPPFVLGGCT